MFTRPTGFKVYRIVIGLLSQIATKGFFDPLGLKKVVIPRREKRSKKPTGT